MDFDADFHSFLDHPKLSEMMSQGVPESDAYTALLVYLNLLEVRGWLDVHICLTTGVVSLEGRPAGDTVTRTVLPLREDVQITHQRLREVMNLLSARKGEGSPRSVSLQQDNPALQNCLEPSFQDDAIPSCNQHPCTTSQSTTSAACAKLPQSDNFILSLGIVARDSTIVYYDLSPGFVTPEPPEMGKETRQWERKHQ